MRSSIFILSLISALHISISSVVAGAPLTNRQVSQAVEAEVTSITERCCDYAYKEDPQSEVDMRRAAWDTNDCLIEEIKQQIRQAFTNPEDEQKMLTHLEKIRTNVYCFYGMLYSKNRYCAPDCGPIAAGLNEEELQIILQDMLKRLITLNRQNQD